MPILLRVPITSSDLPVASVAAYAGYDKLEMFHGNSELKAGGVPYASNTVAVGGTLVKSPTLTCNP